MRNVAYEASIKLAEEKGAFPQYTQEYTRASFIRKLPAKLRLAIKEKGIRNCTLLSSQPTGTTSLIPEVSSGIEPHFALGYERRDRISNRYYIHSALTEYIRKFPELADLKSLMPDYLVDAQTLKPEDHLEVQALIQKYTDNAVSKTINFPSGVSHKELSRTLLEYIKDLKGVAVYVDGSKGEQPVNTLSLDQVRTILNTEWAMEPSTINNPTQFDCHTGECEI